MPKLPESTTLVPGALLSLSPALSQDAVHKTAPNRMLLIMTAFTPLPPVERLLPANARSPPQLVLRLYSWCRRGAGPANMPLAAPETLARTWLHRVPKGDRSNPCRNGAVILRGALAAES